MPPVLNAPRPPPQRQQPLRAGRFRGQTGDGLIPLYRGLAPKAPAPLPTANRLPSGPIPIAWPGGSRPPPAPRPAAAMPVFLAGFRERLSPGRLRQEHFHLGPGLRLIVLQGPELIPAGRCNIPAQIPAGHPGHPRGRPSRPNPDRPAIPARRPARRIQAGSLPPFYPTPRPASTA